MATVPRGWKVRTVTQASGHQARIAFPPGSRRKGAGRLISVLHPQGENPAKCAEGSRQKAGGSNPRGKVKTHEQVEKMQAKAVKFLRDVVGNDDKADEIEALSLDDYAARKKVTLGNPKKSKVESRKSKSANPHISQAWDQASGHYRAQVLGMAGIAEPKQLAALSWKDLPKEAKDVLTGKPKKNKFDTPREKAAYMAGLSSGSRRLGGALETLRRKRATRLERMTGRGLGRRNPKRRRRNATPDQGVSHERTAKALYQKFHGKAPKEVLELQESAAIRGEYTSLGDLVELVVKSPAGESLRIGFAGEKVKLASSPNGGQLYFLGGNQALDGNLARFKTDATKDLVDLGEAQSIVYRAAKDFTGFKSSDWEHAFGEESGERPSAFYDKLKQRIFLVGGTYRVERPGIVN